MKFLYTVVLFFEKKKRRFLEREGGGSVFVIWTGCRCCMCVGDGLEGTRSILCMLVLFTNSQSVERMTNGFVTFYYDHSSSSSSVFSAILILNRSLKATHSSSSLFVITTHDLSLERRRQFQREQIPLLIHNLTNPYTQANEVSEYLQLLNLLDLWSLKQFQKVIFLNAYVLVLYNIDELFECTPLCGLDSSPLVCPFWGPVRVVVLQPRCSRCGPSLWSVLSTVLRVSPLLWHLQAVPQLSAVCFLRSVEGVEKDCFLLPFMSSSSPLPSLSLLRLCMRMVCTPFLGLPPSFTGSPSTILSLRWCTMRSTIGSCTIVLILPPSIPSTSSATPSRCSISPTGTPITGQVPRISLSWINYFCTIRLQRSLLILWCCGLFFFFFSFSVRCGVHFDVVPIKKDTFCRLFTLIGTLSLECFFISFFSLLWA